MTFHCEDGDIDASLNTHRWVDTGWSDPFSPPSPLRRFFWFSVGASGDGRAKKCPTSM